MILFLLLVFTTATSETLDYHPCTLIQCESIKNPPFEVFGHFSLTVGNLFTQPPSGRRRMRICFADVFFVFCFFGFFSVRQKYQTTVLWNGWTDFHETFTKQYPGKCSLKHHAATWRMANVDDLRNLRYDSSAITRGCHVIYAMTLVYATTLAQSPEGATHGGCVYKFMSLWMDLI